MKKIIFILLLFLPWFIASNVQAQWHITGGDNVTSTTQYLGTDGASNSPLQLKTIETGSNALPINFFTNNTERVTIKSNGLLGIGNNVSIWNPAARVEIRENSGSIANLRLSYSSSLFTEFTQTSTGDLDIFNQNSATSAQDNILVGDPSGTSPVASLEVHNGNLNSSSQNALRITATPSTTSTNGICAYFHISGPGNSTTPTYGIYSLSDNAAYQNFGVFGQGATGTNASYGGFFKASSSNGTNYGVYGQSDPSRPALTNFGVAGDATGVGIAATTSNYGVWGKASTTNGATSTNYGVYGSASDITGGAATNYGVYGTAGGGNVAWAGYFAGDAKVTGNFYVLGTPYNMGGTGSWNVSDANLKQNIEAISGDDALQWINQLQPSSYYFDTIQYPTFHFPQEKQFGFIAQDVENILPNMVQTISIPLSDTMGQISDSITIKVLNYQEIIPLVTSALQDVNSKNDVVQNQVTDLQNQVINLQTQLQLLQDQVNGCCNQLVMRSSDGGDSNNSPQKVDLIAPNEILLGNCIPNPNNGNTVIPFHLPNSVVKAEIIFTDQLGVEINHIEVIDRGYSQLSVGTSELEDGVYNYSLVVDGKLIDTKHMVKQN